MRSTLGDAETGGLRVRSELEARLFAGRPLLTRLSRGNQRTVRDLLRRAVGPPG